ncbi:MAG TPA: HD domain-containing protein [Bacteroidia bacterium]|nr:HD domain-containing protein [Bacteroidia bacterium]
MTKKFVDSILFAAKSHAGQLRKDGKTPYINHPLEVMHLLMHTGGIHDTDVLIAAVLHDVIEDTSVTAGEIAERFGENVSKIVQELTDDKSLSKEERKKQQLFSASQLSDSARLVRISDKICNVYDILYAPPGDWEMSRRKDYLEWANAVVGKIRGINKNLEKRFDELIREGNRFLEN